MTIEIEYEAEKKLELPYETIIRDVIEEAMDYEGCPYEAEVSVVLTDNEAIREINRDYRQIDRATDVLSFPMVDYERPADFDGLEDHAEDYFNPETRELMPGGYYRLRGQGGGAGRKSTATPRPGSWRSSWPTACFTCSDMTTWRRMSAW